MSQVQANNPASMFVDDASTPHIPTLIIGAGFSGLGMGIILKRRHMDDFVILEKADDIGGTWRDNTYPGCACDVPSHLYSYSFAPNPKWSRSYSPQREIWEYLRAVAKRYEVTPHIRFGHAMREARWDASTGRWHLQTNQGPLTADVLILGNGPLSEPTMPDIPGIQTFQGTLFHTARWDHAHDLHGERVAIIGTGASAIQVVPAIQPIVKDLVLFQRTPPWIVPRMDHPIAAWQQALYQRLPITQRMVRTWMYLQRELIALGFVYRPSMIKSGEKRGLEHLATQVKDPVLRAKLTPTYTMGCKRVLSSDAFYPAVSQPNVTVEADHIAAIRAHSVVTASGTEYPVDTLICATGFKVTNNPIAATIYGREGRSLADVWQDSPQAYLGMSVAGFPNFFIQIGPNTGLGHTSMVVMIESQLAYIADALVSLSRSGVQTFEVQPTAQAAFNVLVQQRMGGTVWAAGCTSWYLDAKGRNTTIWPGFTWDYRRRTAKFDPEHYILERIPAGVVE